MLFMSLPSLPGDIAHSTLRDTAVVLVIWSLILDLALSDIDGSFRRTDCTSESGVLEAGPGGPGSEPDSESGACQATVLLRLCTLPRALGPGSVTGAAVHTAAMRRHATD